MTLRVVLADDQSLLRKGFRMILEAESDFQIVGEAADGHDAVRLVELYQPDVVLMDVRMPGMDGIEATRRITASNAVTRILILTTFDLDAYAFSALRAGASGFLLKDVPPAELLGAIRTVARGDAVVSPRVTRRLLEEYAQHLPDLGDGGSATTGFDGRSAHGPDSGTGSGSGSGSGSDGNDGGVVADQSPAEAVLSGLTEREREVLLAVADGLSNAEIAERLFVSEATVKSHVGRLLAKLGLRDRVQVVVLAYQTGLVRPA
jgi:DNA-binding NarL/FixJ family response regulator